MRDDHYFVSSYQRRRIRDGQLLQTVDYTLLTTDTFRDDAQGTLPTSDGLYFRPTTYRAFFSRNGTGPATALWWERVPSTSTGTWRLFRDESDGFGLPHSLARYGCTATRPYVPSIPASVESRASQQVMQKIRQGNWSIGQSLAEIPRSLDELKRPLGDAAASAVKFHNEVQIHSGRLKNGITFRNLNIRQAKALLKRSRGGRSAAARAARSASQAYLSFMFGILPIMTDVYNTLELISNGLQAPEGILTAEDTALDDDFTVPNQSMAVAARTRVTGSCKRGMKSSVTFGISDPSLYALQKYGLDNPYALAWELIPLSFVIDWFTHVGTFLQSLIPPIGISFKHGFNTRFVQNNFEISSSWAPMPVLNRIEVIDEGRGSIRYRLNAMSRVQLISYPIPVPYWDLGVKGKVKQLATILLLLTSRF